MGVVALAPSANSGSRRDLTSGGTDTPSRLKSDARAPRTPNSPLSCEALRATALSLSHLTWSMGTTVTIRTCHPTTSFPVWLENSTQRTPEQEAAEAPIAGLSF